MNRLRHILALAVLACAALAFAPSAWASTTCTATMSGWNFGMVNTAGNTDVQATVTYQCNTSTQASLLGEARVRMCLAVGPGSVNGSTIASRRLANGFNESMNVQLYRDPARTQVLGNSPANPTYLELYVEYPLTGFLGASGSTSGTFNLYGRVPPQTSLAAGNYSSTFSDTTLRYRYRELLSQSDPATCETGGIQGTPNTFGFTAIANVPDKCVIDTAGDLDFGSILAASTGLIEKTSTIRLTCTRRTAWQVGLTNGINASGTTRRLAGSGGQYVAYELNRSPGWDRWGSTLNVDTAAGTGMGSSQALTVYGRITNQPLTRAGTYSDTITVIVTY
ncbi:spore coat protein U-like protein [Luteimonas cucumeris]|uniref:Spore coat protein U-like protein n=1 Tax=Luteimonas cucumeris TaxID=985012 RepID=A0A562LBB6_9GAMM|nr:spore coat protein U domain-containing protein [Luteimonas cucumeris]TWI04908.1 spore coat protein U-like protein [Luteimonas cucumeris]